MYTIHKCREIMRAQTHAIHGRLGAQQAGSPCQAKFPPPDLLFIRRINIEISQTKRRLGGLDAKASAFHCFRTGRHLKKGKRAENIIIRLQYTGLRKAGMKRLAQGGEKALSSGQSLIRPRDIERQKNNGRDNGRLPCAHADACALQGVLPVVAGRE